MKILTITEPGMSDAIAAAFKPLFAGTLKTGTNWIKIGEVEITFAGSPVPVSRVNGDHVELTWPEGAKADVPSLPRLLDPRVRQLDLYNNYAILHTQFGQVTLRS
jgi:hypothetical protein